MERHVDAEPRCWCSEPIVSGRKYWKGSFMYILPLSNNNPLLVVGAHPVDTTSEEKTSDSDTAALAVRVAVLLSVQHSTVQ